MMLGAAIAATAGFVLTILVLERVHIVLYPDVFPGRTYIDEDGRRYVYEKQPSSVGGYSPVIQARA